LFETTFLPFTVAGFEANIKTLKRQLAEAFTTIDAIRQDSVKDAQQVVSQANLLHQRLQIAEEGKRMMGAQLIDARQRESELRKLLEAAKSSTSTAQFVESTAIKSLESEIRGHKTAFQVQKQKHDLELLSKQAEKDQLATEYQKELEMRVFSVKTQ
jgi:hypothetical protein